MGGYKVIVEGAPVTLDIDDVRSLFRFSVGRFVEADSGEQAEERALELVRTDPKLTRAAGRDALDAMPLFVRSVEEVPAGEIPAVQPGFSFQPLDEEHED